MGILSRLKPPSFETGMAGALAGVAGIGAYSQFREDERLAPLIEQIKASHPGISDMDAREAAKTIFQIYGGR